MSAVWRYYKVDDNNIAIANCEICKLGIARGGKEKATFNTTNLIRHLKNKHPIQRVYPGNPAEDESAHAAGEFEEERKNAPWQREGAGHHSQDSTNDRNEWPAIRLCREPWISYATAADVIPAITGNLYFYLLLYTVTFIDVVWNKL